MSNVGQRAPSAYLTKNVEKQILPLDSELCECRVKKTSHLIFFGTIGSFMCSYMPSGILAVIAPFCIRIGQTKETLPLDGVRLRVFSSVFRKRMRRVAARKDRNHDHYFSLWRNNVKP